jgi:protocatechuate 3,4-dioxygenase beta subunit
MNIFKLNLLKFIAIICFLTMYLGGIFFAPPLQADIYYVGEGGSGTNTTGWASPGDLQTSISVATTGDEIWVKAATYTPGLIRDDTFQLKNGVGIYGGFNGSEAARSERDWETNLTILSGNIGDLFNDADNSYHVVTGSGTDSSAVLDGFTIRDGYANGSPNRGGGIYNNNGSPTIANCIISNNSAGGGGGGMYNSNSTSTLTNCKFINNSSYVAGGIYNENSSNISLNRCVFELNDGGGKGGGMFNKTGSNPVMDACTFADNSATSGGGGMYNLGTWPEIKNCTFRGNTPGPGNRGGAIYNENASPTIVNCTFSGNTAPHGGGAIFEGGGTGSSSTIRNCTFIGNVSVDSGYHGGAIYVSANSSLTIENSLLANNKGLTSIDDDLYKETGLGSVTSSYNLVEFPTGYAAGTGDITGDQASLNVGVLADNGGATETHALLPGSPAIDAGDPAFSPPPDFDQRGTGFPRLQDGNGDVSFVIDLGAFEVPSLNTPPTKSGIGDVPVSEDAPNSVINLLTAFDDLQDGAAGLTYTLESNSNPGIFAAASIAGGTLTLDYAPNAYGSSNLTVRATDTGSLFVEDSFTVNVSPVNDAPVIQGQQPLSVAEDTDLTIELSHLTVSDPDNAYPAGFSLFVQDGENYTRSGTVIRPALDFNGILTVPVSVSDGAAQSNVFNLSVAVAVVNDSPLIIGQNPLSGSEDTPLTIALTDLTITDPDNAAGDFTLLIQNGTNYTHSGNTVTPALNFNGTLTIGIRVSDGASSSPVFYLTAEIAAVNDAPVVTGQNALSVLEDTKLSLTVNDLNIADPDNAAGDFTLLVQKGDSYTVSGTSITPAKNFNGELTVPVRVSDGTAQSGEFNLRVTVTAVNDLPVITGQESLSAWEDTSLTISLDDLRVTDPDNQFPDDFILKIGEGSDYTLSEQTVIPDKDFHGDLSVPVRVNDGEADSEVFQVRITIEAVNDPPDFTAQDPEPINEDAGEQRITGWASFIPGPANESVQTATYTVLHVDRPELFSAPPEVNADGTLTYTPAENAFGNSVFDIRVQDSGGTDRGGSDLSETKQFTLIINAVNDAPVFTAEPLTEATEDTTYIWQFSAEDIESDPLRITAAIIPSWLKITDNGDGTAVLEGMPENKDVGEHPVEIKAEDTSGASDILSFTILTANINDAPVLDKTAEMYLNPIDEDVADTDNPGTWIAEILSGTAVTDPDKNSVKGIAVIAVNRTGGTWQYTPFGDAFGSYFIDFPADISETNAVLLKDTAKVRFIPDANYNGTADFGIRFRAWDQTVGEQGDTGTDTALNGGTTAFSSGIGTASITVRPVNDLPAFTGEPVVNVLQDAAYTYPILTADHDTGDTLKISGLTLPVWLKLDDNGDGTGILTGIPANEDVGNHLVELEVKDSAGASGTQSFTITVENVNDAPLFTSEPAIRAREDADYIYNITASDIDTDDSLTITAPTLPLWLSLVHQDDGTAVLSGTPENEAVGEHPVILQVSDNAGADHVQSFTITVENVNDAPTFTSQAVTEAKEDELYHYSIATEDPDAGDTRTLTGSILPAWLRLTDAQDGTAILSGTPKNSDVGDHPIRLEVTDAAGEKAIQTFTVTVANVNDAPVFTSEPITQAIEDEPYTYTLTVKDPDAGDRCKIVADILPDWLTLTDNPDGTASLSGTPENKDVGEHEIQIKVKDSEKTKDIQSFIITVANTNDAPLLDNNAELSLKPIAEDISDALNIGNSIAEILGSDPAHPDPVSDEYPEAAEGIAVISVSQTRGIWQYDADRNGIFADFPEEIAENSALLLNDATVIRFVPDPDYNGTSEIVFRAWDQTLGSNGDIAANAAFDGETGAFSEAIQTAVLTVEPVNDTPYFDSTAPAEAQEDATYTYLAVTKDIDSDDTRAITATSLPDWLTLSDNGDGTAMLSGLPGNDDVGEHFAELQVMDAAGGVSSQFLRIQVANINDSPVFSESPVPDATEDALYTYEIVAKDADAADTLIITAQSLPGWLRLLDNGNGTAVISGTPGNEEVGNHKVAVLVTDAEGQTGSWDFTLRVTNTNDPPAFSGTPVTDAAEDELYTYEILAGDSDSGDRLTISAQTLPEWLKLKDNGDGTAVLSGTPGNEDIGDHAIELWVTDAAGETDIRSFTVRVSNTNDPPEFSDAPAGDATEDLPYTYTVIAGDPDSGDKLTISDISLPGWLWLKDNGDGTAILSGTPGDEEVGNHEVALLVTDAAGATGTRTFTIAVTAVNDEPVITDQKSLSTEADMPLTITLNDLIITDPDNRFPDDFTLTVQDGENYIRAGNMITPAEGMTGLLTVPVKVSDGISESSLFNLEITITEPDSDADQDETGNNDETENNAAGNQDDEGLNSMVSGKARSISGTITAPEHVRKIQINAVSPVARFSRIMEIIPTGEFTEYRIEELPPADDYRMEISSPGYACEVEGMPDPNLIDLSETDAFGIDFTLVPGDAVISGTVIFPKSASPGDTVRVDIFSSSTDSWREAFATFDGIAYQVSYQADALLPASDYIVSVWSDRYKDRYYDGTQSGTPNQENAKSVDTNTPEARAIDFIIETGAVIPGTVFREDTSSEIYVEAWSSSGAKGAWVSEDGTFLIEGLEEEPAVLVAWESGMAPFFYSEEGTVRNSSLATRVDIQDGAASNIDIELSVGEFISGAVLDENGEPLSGVWVDAQISLSSDSGEFAPSDSNAAGYGAFTGTDGTYEIKGLPPGSDYQMAARPDSSLGYSAAEKSRISTGSITPQESGTVDFQIAPREVYKIAGTITDGDGNPVPGADVEIWSDSQSFYGKNTMPNPQFSVLNYEITGLPPGDDYTIRVRPPSDSSWAVFSKEDISIDADTVLDIALNPASKITGIVESDESEDLKGVRIIVVSEELNFRAEVLTDESGFYEIFNVPEASDYIVTTVSESHASQEQAVEFGDIEAEIVMTLEAGADISGEVRDGTTLEPIPGAVVEVRSELLGDIPNYSGIAVTDTLGYYAVRGLRKTYGEGDPLSDYRVVVNAAGYPPATETGKSPGDAADFSLKTGEVLSGTVSSANVYDAVAVDIFEKHGDFIKSAHVSADGTFQAEGLASDHPYQLKFIAFTGADTQSFFAQWAGEGDIGFDEPDPFADKNPEGAKTYYAGDSVFFQFSDDAGISKSGTPRSESAESGEGVLKCASASSGIISANPEVTVKWESTSQDPAERYYYLFNRESDYRITKRNAPAMRPISTRRVTSPKLTGDDILYFFHVAPADRRGRIGSTSSLRFSIDTVPPYPVRADAPRFALNRDIRLTLGATGAAEMYISNNTYGSGGKWEKHLESKEWILTQGEGTKKIYVQFRDRAGNTANALTFTEKVVSLPDHYTVTAIAGENGTILPSGEIAVFRGDDLSFAFLPDAGYETDSVFIDGYPIAPENDTYTFRNISADSSVAVSFKEKERITHKINATAGANGIIRPSGEVIVTHGDEQIFVITPDPGYRVASVMLDGKKARLREDSTFKFINVHRDYTISVNFAGQ